MQLTKNFVKAKNPCASGYKWFLRDHDGQGDYQAVLDALVADGRVDDACWLLDQFGPTDCVLDVESIDATALVFAGTLVARRGICVDTVVRAGGRIVSGAGVRAGAAIVAGDNIEAQGSIVSEGAIRAGGDIQAGWGISAGTRLDCAGVLRAAWDIRTGQDLHAAGTVLAVQGLDVGGALHGGQGIKTEGDLRAQTEIVVARGIQAAGDIVCGDHLEAGWGIKAGGDVIADGAIRVGEGIESGGRIVAGPGHGVYAGLRVRMDAWEVSARVSASVPPVALISGYWAADAVHAGATALASSHSPPAAISNNTAPVTRSMAAL
ncbi:FapA family protein [Bordetella sp. BOR01]|uniref:FapA family protein n=1 Tax=Bordetella sp. BOR01 TaxID=2854779 RepID=UPI001C48FE87|nr:FapA family protein [Bordetella sp. BOR01]MBV7486798.1 FapA family protein [Bordetella sp. BOR01]